MYVSGDPYSPWYVNVDVNSYDTIKNIRIPIVQPSGSASAFVSLDGILDMQAIESMHQLSKGKGVQLEPLTE
jgi:hypothetical protein